MRCRACNDELTDFEATRKEANTGYFVDLCNYCFTRADYTSIPVIEHEELLTGTSDETPSC